MPLADHESLSTVTVTAPTETGVGADRDFTLVVTAGPDTGRRFPVDSNEPSRTLLGQSEACQVRLTDPSVSRRHAALEAAGAALRITDLGSTNGTMVDRVRVVEALLTGGELVRVGETTLRVEDDLSSGLPALPELASFGRVVGASREMRRLYPLFEKLAHALVPVIIEGETGTGKEALAEALHEQGPRARGPFVIFDCTAVPPGLVESELFGHERGAFTGAVASRRGLFEQARGGTLLIDEIGDLDPALQPKLLRAVERAEIRRVGGDARIQVDVRILAATRRDLDREVEQGRFREDLYHRLAVARVELPPLRQRTNDVAVLARHFWAQLGGDPSGLSADLLERWDGLHWPGNVRELRNAIARRLALGDEIAAPESTALQRGAAPALDDGRIDALVTAGLPFPRARDRALEIFTERYVAHVLQQHGGNVARAAESSGIGRRYFEKLRARTDR